jgi:hypothetical protein
MNDLPSFNRADFDTLVAAHRELVRLANELEYQLYRLGESPAADRVAECQQAGGALLGRVRDLLFRHDQQVLPMLEALADRSETTAP